MIIHIAGTTGSGKTFIGNLFKDSVNNSFNVIDIDDWTQEFQKKINQNKLKQNKKSFINFIQSKINKLNKNKINLLVGYIDFHIKNNTIVFPIDTNYKLFIDISPDILFKQYNTRLVNYICSNKEKLIKSINSINNKKPIPNFKNMAEIDKMLNDDIQLYVNKMGYVLMSQDKIISNLQKYLD